MASYFVVLLNDQIGARKSMKTIAYTAGEACNIPHSSSSYIGKGNFPGAYFTKDDNNWRGVVLD